MVGHTTIIYHQLVVQTTSFPSRATKIQVAAGDLHVPLLRLGNVSIDGIHPYDPKPLFFHNFPIDQWGIFGIPPNLSIIHRWLGNILVVFSARDLTWSCEKKTSLGISPSKEVFFC